MLGSQPGSVAKPQSSRPAKFRSTPQQRTALYTSRPSSGHKQSHDSTVLPKRACLTGVLQGPRLAVSLRNDACELRQMHPHIIALHNLGRRLHSTSYRRKGRPLQHQYRLSSHVCLFFLHAHPCQHLAGTPATLCPCILVE